MTADRDLHARTADSQATLIVREAWAVAIRTDPENSANLFVAILAAALGTGLGMIEELADVPAEFSPGALGQLQPYILAIARETAGHSDPAAAFPNETWGTA